MAVGAVGDAAGSATAVTSIGPIGAIAAVPSEFIVFIFVNPLPCTVHRGNTSLSTVTAETAESSSPAGTTDACEKSRTNGCDLRIEYEYSKTATPATAAFAAFSTTTSGSSPTSIGANDRFGV